MVARFIFTNSTRFTVVETNVERHIYAIPVGPPFQDARWIIPRHLVHRLLIIIRHTIYHSLALQQFALAVSLVTVVGVIGDVSD